MVANTEEDYLLHVVQPKETVYSIAKKYEAGIEDVKKWNELSTNDLKIGQQVRIKQTR
jgi:LysM repeat protein